MNQHIPENKPCRGASNCLRLDYGCSCQGHERENVHVVSSEECVEFKCRMTLSISVGKFLNESFTLWTSVFGYIVLWFVHFVLWILRFWWLFSLILSLNAHILFELWLLFSLTNPILPQTQHSPFSSHLIPTPIFERCAFPQYFLFCFVFYLNPRDHLILIGYKSSQSN